MGAVVPVQFVQTFAFLKTEKTFTTMFAYEFDLLNTFLKTILRTSLSPEAWRWLEQEGELVRAKNDISKFNIAFVAMPRRTGKNFVAVSAQEEAELKKLRKDFTISGWTLDRLARVWLLLQLNPGDKVRYLETVENLYLNAEMGELVALYSALPLLAHPEAWSKRCAEGIRSNIGQVLEAIICNNPYPSEHLDEAAWNQMVLKAIFTDKPVLEITGLKKRTNRALAQSLFDYAHERWAARRAVNPLLWICVSPFINESNFSDIKRLLSADDPIERDAAALACYESPYDRARQTVEEDGQLKHRIENGTLHWASVAERMKNAS